MGAPLWCAHFLYKLLCSMSNITKPIYLSRLLLALLLPVAGGALAQSEPAGRVSWQDGYEYVSIVASEGKPTGQRPERISSKSLRRALAGLRIRPDGRKKSQPLFSAEAAERLGKQLAVALRQAKRGQDVLFRISDADSFFGDLFEQDLFSAGRVFWHKERLHIIFGGIRNAVKRKMLYGQPGDLVNEPEQGSRRAAEDLEYEMVAAPGIAYAVKQRRDWVVIRLDKVRAPVTSDKRARRNEGRGDIAGRLRKLKRLFDEGLIDEREYRSRRHEILDEI